MKKLPGPLLGYACAGMLFLAPASCKVEQKASAPAASGVIASATLLASVPAGEQLSPPGSSDPAKLLVNEQGRGAVYVSYRSGLAHVVHNGRSGKGYQKIDNLALSPDGQHVAYGITLEEKKRLIVRDGEEGQVYVDVWDPVYSPDSRHIAYIAQVGDQSHIVVDDAVTEQAYPSRFSGNPVFGADSTHVAYHISPSESGIGKLVVASLDLKRQKSWDCLSQEMAVSADKTRVAAVVPAGAGQRAVSVSLANPNDVKQGAPYDEVKNLAVSADGASLTFTAKKGGRHYLVLDGREEILPEGELRQPPVVRPDRCGAGLLLSTDMGFQLYQGFAGGKDGKMYQEAAGLLYSKDGSRYAFLARSEKSIFAVVNGRESQGYDMIVTPRFSPDGNFLVCRVRKDGRRFVVVLDREGQVVREHPSYEMVFDVTFTADGKSVAYGVKQGQQLAWKVEKL